MRTELKFIGQYNASICGTHTTEIIDIFCNDIGNKMYLYRRYSNGRFDFEVIDRNSYNSQPNYNKFDSLLQDPTSHIGIQLFVAWRTEYVENPTLMPMEYYSNILSMHTLYERRRENMLNEVLIKFKKIESYINEKKN